MTDISIQSEDQIIGPETTQVKNTASVLPSDTPSHCHARQPYPLPYTVSVLARFENELGHPKLLQRQLVLPVNRGVEAVEKLPGPSLP
jgi:hypothetical protein